MNDPQDMLRKLPARSIETVLEQLAAPLKGEGAARPVSLPGISLLLEGGHHAQGQLIDYAPPTSREGGTVLLAEDSGRNGLDATYIPLTSIRAIRVHFTPQTLHTLAFGRLKPKPEQVPTRMAVVQRMRGLKEAVEARLGGTVAASILWEQLPSSEEALCSIDALVRDLREVLLEVAGDDLGGDALREKVRQVMVRSGAGIEVGLKDGVLEVRGVVTGEDVRFHEKGALKEAIEGVL